MSKYDVKQEVTDKFSLRGRVFHKLREDILSGKYQEHEELKEVAIGEEMGVSRTPVREAFRQLELEGLIQIIPNKGAYVTGITQKDVKDIYAIRSLLEGLCARWATENISREQMERFLYQLTYGLIRGVVEEQSRGTAISEEDKSFIAEFYKYSFVGVMLDWIRQGMTADPRVLTEKISAAMRGSIANAIRNFSETE